MQETPMLQKKANNFAPYRVDYRQIAKNMLKYNKSDVGISFRFAHYNDLGVNQ